MTIDLDIISKNHNQKLLARHVAEIYISEFELTCAAKPSDLYGHFVAHVRLCIDKLYTYIDNTRGKIFMTAETM